MTHRHKYYASVLLAYSYRGFSIERGGYDLRLHVVAVSRTMRILEQQMSLGMVMLELPMFRRRPCLSNFCILPQVCMDAA